MPSVGEVVPAMDQGVPRKKTDTDSLPETEMLNSAARSSLHTVRRTRRLLHVQLHSDL